MTSPAASRLVFIAGATGYVGGRLLRVLVERGERLRCLARQPEILRARVPAAVEVVNGDCLDASSLTQVLEGVDTAYYLVHSMGAHSSCCSARTAPMSRTMEVRSRAACE